MTDSDDPRYDEFGRLKGYLLERTPIMLGEGGVAVITLFSLETGSNFSDLWLMDYVDVIKDVDHAADQFVKAIHDHSSAAFLMALRRKITATLAEWDAANGKTSWATEL